MFAVEFFYKVCRIDDLVGAISVHMINGVFGTLAVGLFAEAPYATASGIGPINGLFFGGGLKQLAVQTLGSLSTLP